MFNTGVEFGWKFRNLYTPTLLALQTDNNMTGI